SRELGGTPILSPPLVEIRAAEEQLAARSILLSRDSPLGCQLPKRVAMDPEVLGRAPRIEPFVLVTGTNACELGSNGRRDPLRDGADQGVKGAVRRGRPAGQPRLVLVQGTRRARDGRAFRSVDRDLKRSPPDRGGGVR